MRIRITGHHKVLLGLLFSRTGYFALTPFLPVIFDAAGFTLEQAGWVLGMGAAAGAILSVFAGPIADMFGVMRVLALSVGGAIVASLALTGWLGVTLLSAGAVALIGLKSSLDTAVKTFLAYTSNEQAQYERSMKARYFITNVAALAGPALYLIVSGSPVWIAVLCGLSNVMFAALLFAPPRRGQGVRATTLGEWRRFRLDSALAICILHGVCLFYIVSQMTITLPQYFVANKDENASNMIFLLVTWNALLIVLLHPAYHKLSQQFSQRHQLWLGGLFAIGSQLILCWLGNGYDLAVIALASTLFTCGELFLFPTYSITLGRLASRSKQGLYAGLGSLYILGSAIGPIAGAFLLSHAGTTLLFLISAAVGVVSLACSLFAVTAAHARVANAI